MKRVEEVMRDVRVVMDMNDRSDALAEIGDVDTLSIDEIIRNRIEPAAAAVLKEAPYWMVEPGRLLPADEVLWGNGCSGTVDLPDDFLRLVVFEMSDWERPVYTAISATDAQYVMQRQRVKALRGTAQRPVVAIVQRQDTGKALEFYSSKSERAYVKTALYLPYPKIEDGLIEISERCYEAVIYEIAAEAYLTLGEMDKVSAMREQAKTMIQ